MRTSSKALPDFFVHPTSVVDDDVTIGADSKVWHFSHVCSGSRIGHDCTLGQNVYVGPGVSIGDGVKIQNNVSVYEGVTLEDYVFCGPSMVFTNVSRPRAAFPTDKDGYGRTYVERGATLGANCTVVCGTRVGRWSFVAAGAVVTKDVAPFGLMVGVPAKRIGWVSKAGNRLTFTDGEAVCPRTGERYRLGPQGVPEVEESERLASPGGGDERSRGAERVDERDT